MTSPTAKTIFGLIIPTSFPAIGMVNKLIGTRFRMKEVYAGDDCVSIKYPLQDVGKD